MIERDACGVMCLYSHFFASLSLSSIALCLLSYSLTLLLSLPYFHSFFFSPSFFLALTCGIFCDFSPAQGFHAYLVMD